MTTILYSYHNAETPDDMPRAHSDDVVIASKHQCSNCGDDESTQGFDTCLKCSVAICLAEDPSDIQRISKHHAGTHWGRMWDAEVSRQLQALAQWAGEVA